MADVLIVSTALWLAIVGGLLQSCPFLIPYRHLLVVDYGTTLLWWGLLLFVNLVAAAHALTRRLFLKETGDKLAHFEKQLRSGHRLDAELSGRFLESRS